MAHRETPAGPLKGFGEPPADPGQAGPGGPHSGEPAQPVPPGYGQPGYAWPGYMAPGYGAGTYGKPPPTYLIWAIIATVGGVLFNLILGVPFGRIAIRHAREVRRQWDSGHQQAAVAASQKAQTWAILSTVMDVLGLVLFIVVITQPATSAFSNQAQGTQAYRIYHGPGVSFDYPAGWQEQPIPPTSQAGKPLWDTQFVSTNPLDLIGADAYRLGSPVKAADVALAAPPLTALVRHAFGASAIRGGPQDVTIGGIPGLRFQVAGSAGGTRFAATAIFVFKGTTEYFLYCQATSVNVADVRAACAQMTRTFRVNKAP